MLKNYDNYYVYTEFVMSNGKQGNVIHVRDIDMNNFDYHFNAINNILKDGIETEFVQNSFIKIVFEEGLDVELSIPDYFFNIMLWRLIIKTGDTIKPQHLFFDKTITRRSIKKYIDNNFVIKKRKIVPNIVMNNIIDDTLYRFLEVDNFALFFANTMNLEDTIDLMNASEEFNNIIHLDLSNIPIADVKDVGVEYTNKAIQFMENARPLIGRDHCLANSWRAHEGVNLKQYKESAINIGSKPDGQGGVYAEIINKSFITGGTNDLTSLFIESGTGRIAQILSKNNVGSSGNFARLLGLNNTDTFLHADEDYICNTKNFQELFIANENILKKVIDRYYRLFPTGHEHLILDTDYHLIGKTIYLRSPITCESKSKGTGICYRCYGDIAYTNNNINIGKIAAEILSAILTQILLSAKHLLETQVKTINWCPKFFDYFELEGNIVKFSEAFKGYIEIDPNNIFQENEDDRRGEFDDDDEFVSFDNYNEYITEFDLYIHPGKEPIKIFSEEFEKMYISSDFNDVIKKRSKIVDNKLQIQLNVLEECPLFLIPIRNNELSKTMNKLMDIINKNSVTKVLNRHQLLQEFLYTVLEGGLDIQSIHCEVILSNQIRSKEDSLEYPEWEYPNVEYDVLTLNQSLTDNPSVSVTLLYQRLSKTLYTPSNFRKTKPSYLDVFFMEQPQKYLEDKTNIRPAIMPTDVDQNMRIPFTVREVVIDDEE